MAMDFQRQALQGRSWRDQDLAHACFAHADIRGVDFRGANLTAADFSQARAGLGRWWSIGYRIAAVFVAFVVGVAVGSAGSALAFVITEPPTTIAVWLQMILSAVALLAVIVLPVLLLKRGLGASVAGLALVAGIVVLLAPLAPKEVTGMGLVLLAGFGGLLTGAVLLAIVLAVLHGLAGGRWAVALLMMLSVFVAAPTVWETTIGFNHPGEIGGISAAPLLIAGLVTVIFFAVGVYLARQAMAGDARFTLVRTAVIGLLSWGGTSFRGANLTDASFVKATMTFADLRGAILTRTDWQDVRQLERARVDGTYLADPKLRQLATTKRGAGQTFDDLNLEGLNLQAGNLANASFVGANLSQATLRQANLAGAKLAHTQLYDTDLSEACLTGAFIEHWGISTGTRFDDVRCDYVYMHLPTATDPDPMRKPDDNADFFQAGDFSDFIAPIIRTLEYYHQQHTDPIGVIRAAKTLDLMQQRDAIDPAISALALLQLAQRYPEADLEVVSLKSKGGGKVQIHALVSDEARRAMMSAEFHSIYTALAALPREDRERLLSNLVHKDERVRQLEAMVLAAVNNDSFYVETRIRPGGIMKCLLFAANPLQTPQLRLNEEFRAITAKLRGSEYRVFQLISIPAAQPDDLLQALDEHRPKIVQFSGHGASTGELLFVDDQGNAKPVTPRALRNLFVAMKDDIRLVILNACYSEGQAQAIAEVIDCVVGMSDAISDDAAIVFIASFYRALGFGRSIQNAFDQGLAAMGVEGLGENETPRLVTRSGVDPAQVILVAPDVLAPSLRVIG